MKKIPYQNQIVKEKYIDYSVGILDKLDKIKDEMKHIHENQERIAWACIGDLTRIDKDLADILNYL